MFSNCNLYFISCDNLEEISDGEEDSNDEVDSHGAFLNTPLIQIRFPKLKKVGTYSFF